ncbi:MAG: cation-translocating P-type ATPase [Actinomycetota bacterium]
MADLHGDSPHEHEHDFGISCDDCIGEAAEAPGIKPWYREPRVVFLIAAAVVTAIGLTLDWLLPGVFAKAVLGLAIILGVVYPARAAWDSLLKKTLTINTLLIAATTGALALDLWEEAATLVVVFSLGGVLETYAVERARTSLKQLVDLTPREAHVIRGGVETLVAVEDIGVGEFVHVRPGERVPLDGRVAAGVSSVDQAPITGESIPVFKKPGDAVFAGSINQKGSLEIEVSSLSKDTTLAKVIQSVEEHQAHKSTYQRFGERFGRIYTPAMFVVALSVMTLPPLLTGAPFTDWLYRGLVVLVVSCSCGIALSVPVAVVSAIASAARRGVLFKGGAYLELLSGVKNIVFDKTGTLTYGEPIVTEIIPFQSIPEKRLLALAGAIESRSEHPVAGAIMAAAKERSVEPAPSTNWRSIPGLGARAVIDGKTYHAGNQKLIEAHNISLSPAESALKRLDEAGQTLVFVTEGDDLIGLIAVADTVRESAAATMRDLKAAGINRVMMLTGDNEATAKHIALEVGLDDYRAGLLPDDKAGIIVNLISEFGPVAMVGDGVNDAPALAASTVGIAMGAAGSDIAVETGDVALMSDDLSRLPFILNLSRRTVSIIRFNIGAALAVVAVLVSLALLGRIDLVPGLLINEIAAFFIILNSLRLLA